MNEPISEQEIRLPQNGQPVASSSLFPVLAAFYLLFLTMPFSPSAGLIALGLVLVIFVFFLIKGRARLISGREVLAISLFFLWALFTIWFNRLPVKRLGSFFYYTPLLLAGLVPLIRGHLRKLFMTTLFFLSASILLAFFQKLSGFRFPGNIQAYRGERFFSFSGHPIPVSALYSIFAILGICVFFFGGEGKKARIFLALCSLLCVSGLLMTGSRSFYIAFGLTMLFLAARSPKKTRALVAIMLIFCTLAVLLIPESLSRVLTLFDPGFVSNAYRKAMWNVSLKTISMDPVNFLFGVGFGGWREKSHFYFSLFEPGMIEAAGPKHVHNIYLQVLTETGLIGFILFWVFFYLVIKKLRENLKSFSGTGFEYAFVKGVLFSIFCYLTGGLFDYLHDPLLLIPFYTFIAAGLALNGRFDRSAS